LLYIENMIFYRRARASDSMAIRNLIWRVKINPVDLNWHHFLVAVDEHNQLIGCGQIKTHQDGTRELASIAVMPEHQGKGIGHDIIQRLLENETLPLYLTCRSTLAAYYNKFGFTKVESKELPPYLKWIWRIASLFRRIFPQVGELYVMKKTD